MLDFSRALSVSLLSLAAFAFSLGLGACGSRTPLAGSFGCQQEGEVQSCQRGCAQGSMVCSDGFWSECHTVPGQRSCENDCGVGIQACEVEQWGTCVVEPVLQTCENLCGTGTESCIDGKWSQCLVEPTTEVCSFGCGDGYRNCVNNKWDECTAPRPDATVILATVRDFPSTHSDMERNDQAGRERGIVEKILGDDGTPVYTGGVYGTDTTSGSDHFFQWFHDSPSTQTTTVKIPLQKKAGNDEFYQYYDRDFFPIDDSLLGNENNEHNYHFTLEAHEQFIYRKGQKFNFEGDDDMWVFINRHLVIDLGGTHVALSEWVDLDKWADAIEIVEGGSYSIDIFFAERHTIASNFIIRTSIAGLGTCE